MDEILEEATDGRVFLEGGREALESYLKECREAAAENTVPADSSF